MFVCRVRYNTSIAQNTRQSGEKEEGGGYDRETEYYHLRRRGTRVLIFTRSAPRAVYSEPLTFAFLTRIATEREKERSSRSDEKGNDIEEERNSLKI